METKDLPGVVLMFVMVGMILGVGVLIMSNFGTSVKDTKSVTNESLTISSGTGTLAYGNITGISWFGNSTHQNNYTVGVHINYTAATGVVVVGSPLVDSKYNISYSYKAASYSTKAADEVTTALSGIATTWLGLIITVVVLAVILVLVIRSFGAGARK